jgi:hypothetical protein
VSDGSDILAETRRTDVVAVPSLGAVSMPVPPAVVRFVIMNCDDCSGSRAVPGPLGDYEACPSCVIDAEETFVVWEGTASD